MAGPDAEKRLTAILAANVAGYTRRMADDGRPRGRRLQAKCDKYRQS